ncbi:MAG: cysteine hydrolase [Clostridiales bacterium]|nr:cysteine hydrolase [Clostridiales bacterium]
MPSKKVLVIVDYQVDFVTGALGFPEAAAIEEKLCQKIKTRRAEGYDTIFTFDTHGEDYLSTSEGRGLPVPHCLRGSGGWRLYGRVGELLPGGMGYEKSQFGSMELAGYLKEQKYETVELAGVVTHICVLSNAVLAKSALPDSEIVVDASCCASNDPSLGEKALDLLEGLQIKVIGRG